MTPLFLPAGDRRLFALHFGPPGGARGRGGVVLVPPFAEEMNKARRMLALQAQALAAAGFDVLIFDLTGTGESSGNFGDARWELWLEDVTAAVGWLEERSTGPVALVGLRLGALLALDWARVRQTELLQLVLWQPPASGQTLMTQFLRLRLAADLNEAGRVTTKDLRAQIEAGHTIEVAGYDLAPELVRVIDGVQLAGLTPPRGTAVCVFEVAPEPGGELSLPVQAALEKWQAEGVTATSEIVAGPPFWSTQEIEVCPGLIERTTEVLLNRRGAESAEGKTRNTDLATGCP